MGVATPQSHPRQHHARWCRNRSRALSQPRRGGDSARKACWLGEAGGR